MSAEDLSFSDKSFDLVIMFDALEHVTKPKKAINECWRVLKKKGFLYIEYCPYYSLIGHHLYDYTLLPVQFLPKRFTEWLILSKRSRGLSTPQEALKEFYALNKITVRKFKKLIVEKEVVDEQYILKYPGMFKLNLKFLKYLGWFKELLTFVHIALLRKG
jgi:ubiquinone/menaquinone biosynthesis C-methylase UbiE